MADRYESMNSLRESLDKVFDLCGIEKSRAQIQKPGGFAGFLEGLCDDRNLCRFMDTLGSQARRAARNLEDRRLDEWNYQENERRLKALEDEIGQLRKKHTEEMDALRREYEEKLKDQSLAASNVWEPQGKTAAAPQEGGMAAGYPEDGAASASQDEECEAMILNVIAMRDNLLMRREWIRDNDPDNASAARLVEGQLRETGKLLKKAGVEILEDDGMFDSSRHTVVDTKPVDDPLLDNQIAEVFRPGYAYKGKVLRGQEVILYVCRDPLLD